MRDFFYKRATENPRAFPFSLPIISGGVVAARRKAPETLTGLAATGDRRATLEALRNFLAAQIEMTDRDLPALAKQLRDTIAEIDGLPNAKEKSRVDELNARRTARRAKAAG